MPSSDLLALRIKQLQKLPDDTDKAAETLHQSHLKSKAAFERQFQHRLWRDEYKTGDLVLVRNSRVEKELDQKTKPQYLGPFEVLRCTQGGTYILKEMDGTVSQRGVAAFRLLPYHTREGIPLPINDLHLDDLDDSDEES